MRLTAMLIAAVLIAPLAAPPAGAQLTSDAGASILLFPFVVANDGRDTVIQIANRSTRVLRARCSYAAADAASEELPFDLFLMSRQATVWVASRGRPVDATDPQCTAETSDCDGAGLDPGRIPALPAGFRGDLVCIQVDRSGAPTSGNALRGAATLTGADGDLGRYEAIGVPGVPSNDADGVLCLGGAASEGCPLGAEYAACPESWLLGLRAEGVAHNGAPDGPRLHSTLVLATCSRGGDAAAAVQISVTNELEQRLSIVQSVLRWQEVRLADQPVFGFELNGTEFLRTRLTSSSESGSGFIALALTIRTSDTGDAVGGAVAAVPYAERPRTGQDRVVLANP
jgi:hypothetical protein